MDAAQEIRRRGLEALTRHLGATITDALDDPRVIEVLLNPDGGLWIERLGEPMRAAGRIEAVQAAGIVTTVAGLLNRVVTETSPILECELPRDGSRFEALMPPVVARPVFTIRKQASLVFTLADYVEQGIMSQAQREAIEQAVAKRDNVLVCGGTGSGKTTLANAVLNAIATVNPDHRLIVIEDTRELQSSAANTVFLRTSETVDMTRLLRATMRLRPDRIVVGEVRDGSALALLKAWNTGHPGGVGTVHANDAQAALVRVGQLIQEAGVPPAPDLIAQAVNVVVSIARANTGRSVREVARIEGWRQGEFAVSRLA